ncbi:hypothetical protein TRFO_17990 [Tritrichomonas foetus]|uniref:VPS9 domain-containing protein n=1 Tax=Tritrichomonas foetus TaxID=1144522 RepID=A0A1J4KS45_9EUKA|nr:hypothetical protein TRFO_17990 [Tritrichomonas foetus]|eukprot:OHT12293.1 hypothetical protein TRFO_17990 [Tritrichomonas foetus]
MEKWETMDQPLHQKALIDVEPNKYTREFIVDLLKYPTLVPYLSLDFSPQVCENFISVLSELTNFYHFHVLTSTPKNNFDVDLLLNFYSADHLKIHIVNYLSSYLYKQRMENHEYFKNIFCSIIEFLKPYSNNFTTQPIIIDLPKLIENFNEKTPEIIYLTKYLHNFYPKLHQEKNFDPNNEKIYKNLVTKLSPQIKDFSPICSFFDISCYQHIFNAAISSPRFLFYTDIKSLIELQDSLIPQLFNTSIFEIGNNIVSHFHLTNSKSLKIIFMLLFRYIYEEVYPIKQFFKVSDNSQNIIQGLSEVNLRKLEIALKYCPPKTRLNRLPREVFRGDPFYGEAIYYLEEMNFMTNPLDIMLCVQRTVKAIEKAASHYSEEKISFSFDDTFSLFIGVTLASDIPEFVDLANFVNEFVIIEEIASELLHARATLVACSTYLSETLLSINGQNE